MARYVASIHAPGFRAIEPPRMFRSASEAWAFLADARRKAQESVSEYVSCSGDTLRLLERLALGGGDGRVFGTTPGHRPEADPGLYYEVQTI